MLSFLPVFILLSASLAIQVFGRLKMRAGTTWLLAAIVVFATWISMLPIGFLLPQPVVMKQWLPQPFAFTPVTFEYSAETWVFGFLLTSLLVAVIFSEAKHLDSPGYINKITGSMLLSVFGLLAIMARSELAFVLTWSLIDLVEFGALVVLIGKPTSHQTATTSVLFRVVGILLLIIFIALNPATGAPPASAELSPFLWWMMIFMVLFRMGVVPMYLHYSEEPGFQHGLVMILRILPLLSAFSFITFISGFGVPPIHKGFLFVVLTFALLYGSISWFSSSNELKGSPYWIFTMIVFGLIVLLTGKVNALTGLAVVLVAGGSGLFLYSPRLRKFPPFIIILLLSILTIPFTPSMFLSQIFIGEKLAFQQVMWLLGYSFLLAGMIKHSLHRVDQPETREPWMLLFQNIALYFIALSPWIIVGVNFSQKNTLVNWWPSVIIVVTVVLINAVLKILTRRISSLRARYSKIIEILENSLHMVGSFLKLTWLSRLLASIVFIIEKVVHLFNRVLEGDGGILWSFLFLVLLLSLLFTRQVP